MPNGTTGEADYGLQAQHAGCLTRLDHLFGCTLMNTFRLTISPDVSGNNGFVPFVQPIADTLANQMVRQG